MDLRKKNISSWLIPFFIFVFTLACSILLYFFSLHSRYVSELESFKTNAEVSFNAIERNIDVVIATLRSLQSFLHVNPHLSRKEFREYSLPIINAEVGIQALGWDLLLTQEQLAEYQKKAQAEGFPDFYFYEKDKNGKNIPVKPRPYHIAVYYVEPLEKNKVLLGYDNSYDESRQNAIKKAIQTDTVAATDRITLVQQKYGIVFFLPVYKSGVTPSSKVDFNSVEGLAFATIRIEDVINDSLRSLNPNYNIYVFDRDAPPEKQLLYEYDKTENNPKYHFLTISEAEQAIPNAYRNFSIGGRTWTFWATPKPSFFSSNLISASILLIGFFISILFSLVARYIIVNTQQKMSIYHLEDLVKERTNQLENEKNVAVQALASLKTTQSKLVQSEKMASLGVLTAGIAHEINNPMTFVLGNIKPLGADITEMVELLKSKIPENDSAKTEIKPIQEEIKLLLAGIENGAQRTTAIVQDLRKFARLDESDLKKINLEDSIETVLAILSSQYIDRIEIKKEYGHIPPVECYPAEINQVLMNILSNAIYAIKNKGIITIKTRLLDGHVQISIKDTGIGMSEAIKQKIFDPFFTTKEIGKGTGLGLSISLTVINSHKGTIEVNTEEGKGSEFIINLPITQ